MCVCPGLGSWQRLSVFFRKLVLLNTYIMIAGYIYKANGSIASDTYSHIHTHTHKPYSTLLQQN